MLLIVSTLSFLYIILKFIYSTFIYTFFSYSFTISVLITCCLCISWQQGAVLLHLLFHQGPREAEDLTKMRISMTITAWYPTITIIVKMTIDIPKTTLFNENPRMCWASGRQNIPLHQHLEHKSLQPNWHPDQRNPYILSIVRPILSRTRRINTRLSWEHPGRYQIMCLNDWIPLLAYILNRGRIQMKLISNWFQGKLPICGDMSPLLTTWQASSSAQNTMPKQLSQAFRRYSWHRWSLSLSIMWCL